MPRIVHILGDIPDDRQSNQPQRPKAEPEIDPSLAWCLDPYAPVPSGYEVEVTAPQQDETEETA